MNLFYLLTDQIPGINSTTTSQIMQVKLMRFMLEQTKGLYNKQCVKKKIIKNLFTASAFVHHFFNGGCDVLETLD